MDKNAACKSPLKRAVSAARNVMRSRTGKAILKQSYVNKHSQAGKNIQILEDIKDKELRRLMNEQTQFIFKQDKKLQSPSTVRRKAAVLQSSPGSFRKVHKEKKLPQILSPLLECGEAKASVGKIKEERTPRFHVVSARQNKNKFDKGQSGQNGNTKELMPGAGTPKTARKEEAKLLNASAMAFYDNESMIAEWIKNVDEANTREELVVDYHEFARSTSLHRFAKNNSSNLTSTDIDAGRNKNHEQLKFPKIDKLPFLERHPRLSVNFFDSITDPRFTNLMESLTPASKPLKLPNIAKEDEFHDISLQDLSDF